MEINRKVLISLFIIGILALGIGWGTHSLFTDTETSSGNRFTAATLDLEVGGSSILVINVGNIAPGYDSGYYKWILKNVGSIPGKVSVTFSVIVNDDNGLTEPESACDTTGGSGEGELGQYLKPGIHPDDIPEDVKPYVTIIERNDEEGWWIGEVSAEVDTGGTIGWGPKGSSVPSKLLSIWQTGPPHPWGVPGLNGLGGKTYGTLGYLPGDILNPGQEVAFFFRVELDSNLRIWDGTKWIEVDDNIIQSDSVTFSITFRLEQVP
jgi:predicted ribosomally synthesized peptide with SipW-like signal peptide